MVRAASSSEFFVQWHHRLGPSTAPTLFIAATHGRGSGCHVSSTIKCNVAQYCRLLQYCLLR